MKIHRIYVENYKAVDKQELVLNGCSAIVTGGNNQGKTSILADLIDRLRSEKPDVIVKDGEEKGKNVMELTDNSKVEWSFTQKSETIKYTTPDGITQSSGVIGTIGERYFGQKFDIDQFLNSPPKQQKKWLQKVSGLDLEEVDQRYQQAYADRTETTRELERLKNKDMTEPEQVEKPDVDSIKQGLKAARAQNQARQQAVKQVENLKSIWANVTGFIDDTPFADLFDHEAADEIIQAIDVPEKQDIETLEAALEEAQAQLIQYNNYEKDLERYQEWETDLEAAQQAWEQADQQVKAIEQERAELIANAEMPDGFEITEDGLKYEGYPLGDKQQSKSNKYIAALKLGERVLGTVRTLHFDASNLDKHSLSEVQEWAESKDLQLLIERPDFDGGDIQYELIAD